MYSNNPLILQLLSLLKQFGIKRIVVSPGGRHVQLVLSLEQDDFFELYSVVDERSAAFFALGLIQAYNEPVAVACSSGTACMNYGSAITEAFYQRLPLLVLSADRLPAFLNQGEEQMYSQLAPFKEITKYQVQLPEIKSDLDLWYCNRLINEALLELTNHGRGPVQINFPMKDIFGNGFDRTSLPTVRKISINTPTTDFNKFQSALLGKKVLLIWGQSVFQLQRVAKAVKQFSNSYDVATITDCISDCPLENSIRNTFVILQTLTATQRELIIPDIVISFGGNQVFNVEIKDFLRNYDFEHWYVGPQTNVCDPFHKLKEIFEMDESYFFERMTVQKSLVNGTNSGYMNAWLELSKIPTPKDTEFNEVFVIGSLINRLPDKCSLQLANSNTIRIASYFNISPKIEVHCNRGVNGIDGSMSTAIGFACARNELVFYITGELSFFYDMNSLWIKHVTPNLRILIVNNDGGAFMYSKRRIVNGEPSLTLAANNHVDAQGWAQTTGFDYISATNKEEFESSLRTFLTEGSKRPIILEVFTTMRGDRVASDCYIASLDKRTVLEKIKGRLERSKFNVFK